MSYLSDLYRDPAMRELIRCCIGQVRFSIVSPKNIEDALIGLRTRLRQFRSVEPPDVAMIIFRPVDGQKKLERQHPDSWKWAEILSLKILQQNNPKFRSNTVSEAAPYFVRLLSDPRIAQRLELLNMHENRTSVIPLDMGFLVFNPSRCLGLMVSDINWPFTRYDRTGWMLPRIHLSETNGVLALLSLYMAERDGVVAHGTGISYRDKGFLFLAPSGGGKTTLSTQSPPGTVLADDGLIVRETGTGYALYPTPFRQRPGGAYSQMGLVRVVGSFECGVLSGKRHTDCGDIHCSARGPMPADEQLYALFPINERQGGGFRI